MPCVCKCDFFFIWSFCKFLAKNYVYNDLSCLMNCVLVCFLFILRMYVDERQNKMKDSHPLLCSLEVLLQTVLVCL